MIFFFKFIFMAKQKLLQIYFVYLSTNLYCKEILQVFNTKGIFMSHA
ncbi:unnamed protein product [Larinioides sclopetarius]|uniref:Uncharacterized protein n=1 Tax=Larinioides sclopetarius TaxID=280406 RepID=A0AAV2BEK9_9ARAC